MTDYKAIFKDITSKPIDGDHIRPTPRYNLREVYVFTNIPTNQLRADFEGTIGSVSPDISYAEYSILYVLQTELPEKMPTQIKDAVNGNKLDTNAVFIRGATNHFLYSGARREAGEILSQTLKKLEKRHDGNIHWRFKEAEDLLDPEKILREYDEELARMEFQG